MRPISTPDLAPFVLLHLGSKSESVRPILNENPVKTALVFGERLINHIGILD
ncbi:hypothetical protein TG4357_01307 [Thalassovita gelatinovora]|uniref:Uncharacterized protein n=1 Tax=Thalassovita gelatinovora TaxID=53501 RepID=A0A0N7LUU6_THAGE|nr:hypothetical protein [Thalassovita gelatinovora]CUH64482.1 hypothetical protein TG4357_01307 [Thalassovita gelatinovora]SEP97797.1 hypothetical protein SAMN04488043_102370 [Thalassovita gelatinovora]